MTSTTFFLVFIPLLAIILLAINIIFAPHNPYQEKESTFECGFHSFLGQNRTQFAISFFIFALLFLLFDLEILLIYPYVVSAYVNDIYGLVIMLIFFLALTLGFVFEFGKGALKIDSRQMLTVIYRNSTSTLSHHSGFKVAFSFLFKYFSLEKIFVSLISLILIALLRFAWYGGFSTNPLSLVEAFTIGVPAIAIKLGVQGLIDWIFQDLGFKTWLLDIFNGPLNKENMFKIDHSTNSNTSSYSNKPWKILYNSKDSDDGNLENTSVNNSDEESELSSESSSESELNHWNENIKPLPVAGIPSPSTEDEADKYEDGPLTQNELFELVKAENEIRNRHQAKYEEYSGMRHVYDAASRALEKPASQRTQEDIEALALGKYKASDGCPIESEDKLKERLADLHDRYDSAAQESRNKALDASMKSQYYKQEGEKLTKGIEASSLWAQSQAQSQAQASVQASSSTQVQASESVNKECKSKDTAKRKFDSGSDFDFEIDSDSNSSFDFGSESEGSEHGYEGKGIARPKRDSETKPDSKSKHEYEHEHVHEHVHEHEHEHEHEDKGIAKRARK